MHTVPMHHKTLYEELKQIFFFFHSSILYKQMTFEHQVNKHLQQIVFVQIMLVMFIAICFHWAFHLMSLLSPNYWNQKEQTFSSCLLIFYMYCMHRVHHIIKRTENILCLLFWYTYIQAYCDILMFYVCHTPVFFHYHIQEQPHLIILTGVSQAIISPSQYGAA